MPGWKACLLCGQIHSEELCTLSIDFGICLHEIDNDCEIVSYGGTYTRFSNKLRNNKSPRRDMERKYFILSRFHCKIIDIIPFHNLQ